MTLFSGILRWCRVCQRMTEHYPLRGEGCVAWLCCKSHFKEASRANNVVVGIPDSLPQVPKGTDPAKL
jgi:hypothetical protein